MDCFSSFLMSMSVFAGVEIVISHDDDNSNAVLMVILAAWGVPMTLLIVSFTSYVCPSLLIFTYILQNKTLRRTYKGTFRSDKFLARARTSLGSL